jgi:predicted helicase
MSNTFPRKYLSPMTSLHSLLSQYRSLSQSEREKGTYFERLIQCYLTHEASYKDLYEHVWMYADWAREQGVNAQDAGIDLVARTTTGELHAVQCKLYAEDYRLQKGDIDSFFTASGKKTFSHRLIVSTTNHWSAHAEQALENQQPPVTRITLSDLEQSQIDWSRYQPSKAVLKPRKELRPHQRHAVESVRDGLQNADRGKLIMACGSGKTFTALKIAEEVAGKNRRVLFLVPSLSLLSQTLTEWTQESAIGLHCFAVCSDSDVGKKASSEDDAVPVLLHELRYPATTDAKSLAREMEKRHDAEHMSVVFSTYHSIEVLSQAQKKHGLAEFDLIVCDEAHRTTGAIFESEDESAFVRVHDAAYLRAKKRLYMTATPRIFADVAKAKAEQDSVALCSMDDPALYGEALYVLTFSEAVRQKLLVDYKVVVLAVEETHVSRRLQGLLANDDNQLKVDDAAKIVGCWKALSKQGLTKDLVGDDSPMRRAVAFCQVIEPTKARVHKVASTKIAAMFQKVVEAYQEKEGVQDAASRLTCEAAHVDGTMNASQKDEKLSWLKADAGENTCRILSNVRCLSEGVDVPALDAVLFLTPRNSQVDVVQSVGRVMRNAPGKQRGYVILPVVIPAGMEPHEALNDNTTYKVVWQVLQALRSHDDRFDAMVNKMDLDLNRNMLSKMEVIAITDKVPAKPKKSRQVKDGISGPKAGRGEFGIGSGMLEGHEDAPQQELQFEIGEIERAIYAKVVQKCGNRHHWEDWANDISRIARTHIDRITGILEDPSHSKEREAFQSFAKELRDDLNDSISDTEIIEMLAQHLITKPVFDALFAGYSFASQNPISQAMQGVLDVLQEHRLDKEADTLEAFYASVRERAEGIDNAAGKQKIVVELYDKFFRNAFPKMTERLGIVYTPVEVVDFILHSVNHLLQTEFGQTVGSPGVHILDPFTGTGTFITRLLQSGLIKPQEMAHKYKHEIHANEIVLLAYYIAAINIEAVYHSIMGGDYVPFEGICLTDTFQLYEKEDLISQILVDNSARRTRQKALDIRVIIGNPPYSSGQNSANDNNQNVSYRMLDGRISETYAAQSSITMVRSLYDSYIRSIRWASDRIGKSGVIGFVTNAGFVEANSADGLRKCLANEFSSVHIFHLRGNQRTQGENSRREGGKIFGSGSRAPIAISFLVKNPTAKDQGRIFYHDIGDYLTREEKLQKIVDFGNIAGIAANGGWQSILPDEHGDWIKQRDDNFDGFIVLGDKKGDQSRLFETYSCGVKSNRDAWVYNFSTSQLLKNVSKTVTFFNSEVRRFEQSKADVSQIDVNRFIHIDSAKIAWADDFKGYLRKGMLIECDSKFVVPCLYRPYTRQMLYNNKYLNWSQYKMPGIFPDAMAGNFAIVLSGPGEDRPFSVLMAGTISDLHAIHGGQCFPLYLYDEPTEGGASDLFASETPKTRTRRDAITKEGLAHFQAAYPNEKIVREDIFYYVYGLLHSPDYRERYADNLSKELPRIPCVKQAADFWAFSKAGRALAELHLNYETVEPYPVEVETTGLATDSLYRVEKMRYGKTRRDGKSVDDKSILVYNDFVTLRGIPLEAYDYVVNGKSALDWVVERQCVKVDKDSGIVNDANLWATETMENPKYPLELFQRVITVSLETMKIVNGLPGLEIG